MQQPKLVRLENSFSVVGLQVRTDNISEFNPDKSQIPDLWKRFFEISLVTQRSYENDPCVYGVYSNYVTDHSGEYIVTAGINKLSILSDNSKFEEVIVQEGNYLVFEAVGKFPESVINAWQYIWKYFQGNVQPKRKYTTDFEKYISEDKAEIYISVED